MTTVAPGARCPAAFRTSPSMTDSQAGRGVRVGRRVGVTAGVWYGTPVPVAVAVGVRVPVGVALAVGLMLDVGIRVCVGTGVSVTIPGGVSVGVGDSALVTGGMLVCVGGGGRVTIAYAWLPPNVDGKNASVRMHMRATMPATVLDLCPKLARHSPPDRPA